MNDAKSSNTGTPAIPEADLVALPRIALAETPDGGRIMTIGEASIAELAYGDRFFVGGKWVEPDSAGTFEVINPSSGDRLLRVPAATAADMSAAVGAARAAFDHGPWSRLSHAERAGYLRKIATEIRRRGPELAALWSGQVGVLLTMSSAISVQVADVFDYYAGLAGSFAFVERHAPTAGGEVGLLVREPVGVVAAIIPWNGPLGLIAYKTAPALLAGCTVVLKPSPEAPGEAYVFAEIAAAVGLPDGVVNVVTADREVSELLVRDPRVDKVTFTGSTAAGRGLPRSWASGSAATRSSWAGNPPPSSSTTMTSKTSRRSS